MMDARRRWARILAWALATAVTAPAGAAPADERDALLAGRPAFSAADEPARAWARCADIRPMAAGLPAMDERIDLSVTGKVAEVKTDGILWYVVVCNAPDVKVLCVTYSANDLKAGATAFAKGGYRRIDDNHALLDPCLASDQSEW